MIKISEPMRFQWDKGNKDKNWEKHKVSDKECEEIFFDESKKIYKDKLHSEKEDRYILLGKTKRQKLLYLIFTVRNKKIRVISARDTNWKERRLYEKAA